MPASRQRTQPHTQHAIPLRGVRCLTWAVPFWLITLFACFAFGVPCRAANDDVEIKGVWQAELLLPEAHIRFLVELHPNTQKESDSSATLINGEELISVPMLLGPDSTWRLEMPHYDSNLQFRLTPSGELKGTWRIRRSTMKGVERFGEMEFHAKRIAARQTSVPLKPPSIPPLPERWAMRFADSPDVAVGLFQLVPNQPSSAGDQVAVRGTVLTTTGDYRFLAGTWDGVHLEISCFDGSHAFRIAGERDPRSGTMSGVFQSGNWYTEKWTAKPDPTVELPDPFQLTQSREIAWDKLQFPDRDGVIRSLNDVRFRDRPRIIEIFGTWCPNCHDAAPLLSEWKREYQAQGLEVIGIACEQTGDAETDRLQVARYVERFGIDYPVLILGESDKEQVSLQLPIIDALRAYPTFLFVDRRNRVQAIYTGFSGPATGAAHLQLRESFQRWTEKIIGLQE